MAAAVLQAELSGSGGSPRVESAGVRAVVGHPATEEAKKTAAARQLDLSAHRGRQLDAALAASYELLLVMEEAHLGWITRHLKSFRGRAFLLGHWQQAEVPDPIGRPLAEYEAAFELISRCAKDWVSQLK